jgi:REP-associated tyrosine transposase
VTAVGVRRIQDKTVGLKRWVKQRRLWPRSDGELSEVMRWIKVTHTQRWHAHHHSSGSGPLYQGRFKSFPVQTDEHFITAARYVERNALRAKLVDRDEEWRWSSLFQIKQNGAAGFNFLTQWPMERPQNWIEFVNAPDNASELDDLRSSAQRGRYLLTLPRFRNSENVEDNGNR